MKTGNGLSEYARVHLGTPYFYGAKIPEGALTERKMSIMHAMYRILVMGERTKNKKGCSPSFLHYNFHIGKKNAK